MRIQRVTQNDFSSWLTMRKKLWPHCPDGKHDEEMKMQLLQPDHNPVFIAVDDLQNPVGFIENSIHNYASGCHSSPVGYIEGWYVEEAHRKIGIGKDLVKAAENWFVEKGFIEMASDAELHNKISIEAHKRLGYKVICEKDGEAKFLKELAITETVFGEKLLGINYTERVGAYAVISNKERKVALIKTSTGYFLPGGGIDNDENYKDCLEREILEEIGCKIYITGWIGKASKYHYSDTLKYYMHGIGYFYKADLGEKISKPIEVDHMLVWHDVDEAVQLLFLEHQKWAVSRILTEYN